MGPALRIAQGTRSGLWLTITEGIRVLAPSVIVVENVAALRSRGLGKVLGDLAALGYRTAWVSLCAAHIGAAHRRERVFVLAYNDSAAALLATTADANSPRQPQRPGRREAAGKRSSGGVERSGDHAVPATESSRQDTTLADANGTGRYGGTAAPTAPEPGAAQRRRGGVVPAARTGRKHKFRTKNPCYHKSMTLVMLFRS